MYPRKALLVHDLPEYDPAAQYSAGCKVKDVPLGVFTTLGPYDVPFQAYRALDENSEEQVTPLLSWQCDRERRQAVVDAKAARAKTTELAPADMEFSQPGSGLTPKASPAVASPLILLRKIAERLALTFKDKTKLTTLEEGEMRCDEIDREFLSFPERYATPPCVLFVWWNLWKGRAK